MKIRVREFAKKRGCTPQNVYLHLKNYADELEGHVFKEGRSTFLDEYAQELIITKMNPKDITSPEAVAIELNELRQLLSQTDHELAKTKGDYAALNLNYKAAVEDLQKHQLLLKAADDEKQALSDENADLNAQLQDLEQTLADTLKALETANSRVESMENTGLVGRILKKWRGNS